jgi:hypothetical protein
MGPRGRRRWNGLFDPLKSWLKMPGQSAPCADGIVSDDVHACMSQYHKLLYVPLINCLDAKVNHSRSLVELLSLQLDARISEPLMGQVVGNAILNVCGDVL